MTAAMPSLPTPLTKALDVTTSCWVNASAGSGKTTVLVGRIVTLLIQGTEPDAILCLTFTQRAAKEMHHRLTRDIQAMIHQPDALDSRWMLWLGRPPLPEELDRLHRCWQQWETSPLTIQTFHSFCHQLLSRFPVESVSSLPLRLLDAPQSQKLWDQSCQWIVNQGSPDDELAPLIKVLCVQGVRILEALQERGHSGAWSPMPMLSDISDILSNIAQQSQALDLFLVQGWPDCPVTPPKTEGDVLWWEQCRSLVKGCEAFVDLVDGIKKVKDLDFAQWLKHTKAHLDQWRHKRDHLHKTTEQQALDVVWWGAYKRYVEMKNGALDFDDLIGYTLRLLDDSPFAGWALHGLHRGYRHILVDEAQDTSVLQWRILRHVIEAVVCQRHRTIFVVGDSKQSIYGFQGADVSHFSLMEDFTKAWVNHQDGGVFQSIHLDQSYRSAPVILDVVNAIFQDQDPPTLPVFRPHSSAHTGRHGSVVLFCAESTELADHVALWVDVISSWIKHPLYLSSEQRSMDIGDIMILLPRRTSFYKALEEALIQEGWMQAQTFHAQDHPTMQWMAAWLGVAMDPYNDVAMGKLLEGLATSVGASGHWLWRVAYQRQGAPLFQRMIQLADRGDKWCQSMVDYVQHIQRQRHNQTTAELMTQWIYQDQGGVWLQHLDPCVASVKGAIDAWLTSLCAWPGDGKSFLHWMHTYNPALALPPATGVRLMTIHGAKGAEAPVVLVPDLPDPVNKDDPEHWRLLYVALTRAKDHLILGSRSSQTPWYRAIEKVMCALGTVETFRHHAGDRMCWNWRNPKEDCPLKHQGACTDTPKKSSPATTDFPHTGKILVSEACIRPTINDQPKAHSLSAPPCESHEACDTPEDRRQDDQTQARGFTVLLRTLSALHHSEDEENGQDKGNEPTPSVNHTHTKQNQGSCSAHNPSHPNSPMREELPHGTNKSCARDESTPQSQDTTRSTTNPRLIHIDDTNKSVHAADSVPPRETHPLLHCAHHGSEDKEGTSRQRLDRLYVKARTSLLGKCVHQLLDELPFEAPESWSAVAVQFLHNGGFSPTVCVLWAKRIIAVLSKKEWAPLFADSRALSEVEISRDHHMRRIDRLLVHANDAWIIDFKTSSPVDMTHWDLCVYGQQLNEYQQWVQQVYPTKTIHTGLLWVKTGELVWKPNPYPLRLWSEHETEG